MTAASTQTSKKRLPAWKIVLLIVAALVLLTLALAIVPNPLSTVLYEHNYHFRDLVDALARLHLSAVQH